MARCWWILHRGRVSQGDLCRQTDSDASKECHLSAGSHRALATLRLCNDGDTYGSPLCGPRLNADSKWVSLTLTLTVLLVSLPRSHICNLIFYEMSSKSYSHAILSHAHARTLHTRQECGSELIRLSSIGRNMHLFPELPVSLKNLSALNWQLRNTRGRKTWVMERAERRWVNLAHHKGGWISLTSVCCGCQTWFTYLKINSASPIMEVHQHSR